MNKEDLMRVEKYAEENSYLFKFIEESNRIEGIFRTTDEEIKAHQKFLSLKEIKVEDVAELISILQPDAVLREKEGLNVRVGDHVAPKGGEYLRSDLADILESLNLHIPFSIHQRYENLHPFTDGNGRSGRAIWFWQHVNEIGMNTTPNRAKQLGFLHTFYYETLQYTR